MTAPPRHDVICRFGMAVMCPLMMSLNYRAGSVIDSNAAQDNLLSNFAPDEQTVRRPPRSLHSTLSTPQYRVLRLRSRTLPSVRKVRNVATRRKTAGR